MPDQRHSLEALEDCAVLLTVAKLTGLASRNAAGAARYPI